MARATSCGVLVTDGARLLLGHATRSPRWDIPKGLVEPGEDFRAAALRELQEETGLVAAPGDLQPLGIQRYMPGKDLVLFIWRLAHMPDVAALVCHASFALPSGSLLPEFDRFGVFGWDEALTRVGKNLARVLAELRPRLEGLATPPPDRPPAPGRSPPARR